MAKREIIPVIGICGWKGSGKTTLCVRLIEEFVKRGLKVSSIKHSDHDFHFGSEETDSEKHRMAGAHQVALVGTTQWAITQSFKNEQEPRFEEVLAKLSEANLVIVEGYKKIPIPKIETRRLQQKEKNMLWKNDNTIMAIAADYKIPETTKPIFPLDAITSIADFIEHAIGPLCSKNI